MLGGRAAEELVFNEMTAGASSDISLATRIARAMVEDFGMSSLGPINMGSQSDEENDIPSWMDGKGVSQATKEKVDLEITKIMEVAHREATALIKKHRVSLDKVSKALLDKETLDRDEFEAIVGKKKNGVEEKISG
jgi:cell division protease FtsH